MAFKPTPEQELAINSKGSILVSAAAGSGKTAVLVERVITRLTDKTAPISADRLLIVTFTNAAAAEMRTRIEKRLDEECKKHPDDKGLIMQRQQITNAKICTIDSFCIDLVRENFERAGVSPDFKISDGYSLRPVDERVLSGIITEYFNQNDPQFLELLDIIGAEYDEGNFLQFVLEIYNYSRQLPFTEKWFRNLGKMYNGGIFDRDNVWYKYAVKRAEKLALGMRETAQNTVDILMGNDTIAQVLLPSFLHISELINELLECKDDWDKIYNTLNKFIMSPLPRTKSSYEGDLAKSAWNFIKKDCENLQKLFYSDLKGINAQFAKLFNGAELLSDILIKFEKELFSEYSRRNTYTFHNTEHLALSLLCDKEGNVNPDACEIISRYDEIMVDEYQDTNDLQDMLFYVLSDKGKKLFAVGDVKQSIYGFRGANPANFLNKKNNAHKNGTMKIVLSNNFRCHPQVCDYVNFVFKNIMTENTGDIVYGGEEELIAGANFPKTDDLAVRLDILENKSNAEKKLIAEANHIADYIEEVVSSGECIRKDDNTLREAKYSDFTVLLRSAKNKAQIIASTLRERGIPADFASEGYAETYEVAVMLALLKVIDNPDSDIELLTIMLSPILGFSTDEIGEIRANHRSGSLYSALVFAAQNNNSHAKEVLERLENYRLLSVTLPIEKLISRLLIETDYLNIVSAMSDGIKRRNNLLLLVNYSEQYRSDNKGGIGGFVDYILKQSKSGMKSAAVTSGSDTVKIMSIHSSKGLQFPVCIIADTSAEFNDNEAKNNVLYSTEMGVGFRYFDEEEKIKKTTVSREVILDNIRNKTAEEELRLLYVAMTRTQDKLFMVTSLTDWEKTAKECKALIEAKDGKIDEILSRVKSYGKMLILTALKHPNGKILRGNGTNIIPEKTNSRFEINVINCEEEVIEERENIITAKETDEKIVEKIKKNISFEYPYKELSEIEAKSSVSAIANKAESDKYAFSSKPKFMSKNGITATGMGTAMHKVIEFFDFDKADNIEEELNRLYEWQFITEAQAQAVSKEKLIAFFKSDLFRRIKNAKTVKREMRFLTELTAEKIKEDISPKFAHEKIIIQGAVDLCFVEDGQVVVLDFKTDRVSDEKRLIESYGEQLSVYAMACEKIFGLPIKEKLIWSFSLSKEIRL